ncbi:MAG: Clp protease ClpP [Spirochaetales bacterium]|nr:Clp protease ClpP [Spirochaetales bacterium]
MKNKKFWNWKNEMSEDGNTSRVLELYGTIASESWFDDDVTPAMFKDELYADTGPVTIWINSPGGDCIAASQIYSMLIDYPGTVTVKIDGVAASAASVIAMAGTEVLMAPTALMMIHNPATMAFGDHNDMKAAVKMLDEVKQSIINAYSIRTGLSDEELSRMMEAETWMNARKAIALGFADGMLEDSKRAVTDVAAFSYAQKTTEDALKAKLVAKYSKPKVNTGREISALLEKLNSMEVSV